MRQWLHGGSCLPLTDKAQHDAHAFLGALADGDPLKRQTHDRAATTQIAIEQALVETLAESFGAVMREAPSAAIPDRIWVLIANEVTTLPPLSEEERQASKEALERMWRKYGKLW